MGVTLYITNDVHRIKEAFIEHLIGRKIKFKNRFTGRFKKAKIRGIKKPSAYVVDSRNVGQWVAWEDIIDDN